MSDVLDTILANCEELGECRVWLGHFANGSPQHYVDGQYRMVRRLVHEATTGAPIKKGLHPTMKCRDPRCVQFDHMSLLTTKQISNLAHKEGRFSTPARRAAVTAGSRARSTSKLTAQIAAEIRNSDESCPVLAARYGINKSLAARIKRGEAWRTGVANNSVFNQAA